MTRFEVLLLVSSLVGSGHCLQARFHAPWRPSQETSRAELNQKAVDGVSPVPTNVPRPQFAAIPELRRDVSSNTCGFRTDDGSPMYCDDAYTCTNSGSIRDCCSGNGCFTSTFATACLDATADICSTSGGHPGQYCCTYDALYPYCVTYLWATTATPNSIFTFFMCDESSAAGAQQFLSPTNPFARTTTTSSTSSSRSTSSEITTTLSPLSTSSLELISSTTEPLTSTLTVTPTHINSPGGGGSSTPIGAIVGGTVGGVALIGLVALGAFLIIRRTRKKNQEVAPGGVPLAEPKYGPGPQSPPPPSHNPHHGMTSPGPDMYGGAYDPRYSHPGSPNTAYSPHQQQQQWYGQPTAGYQGK